MNTLGHTPPQANTEPLGAGCGPHCGTIPELGTRHCSGCHHLAPYTADECRKARRGYVPSARATS